MASKLLTYKFNADTQTAEKKIERLEQSFKGLQVALEKDVRQLTKFANQTVRTNAATSKFTKNLSFSTNTIVRHIRRVESLVVAYYSVSRAYDAILGKGIEFNIEMEKIGIKFKGIIGSMAENKIVGQDGFITDIDKWRVAGEMADKLKKSLKTINVETPHGLVETGKIMAALAPETLRAGASMEKLTKLTKLFSLGMTAGNVSMREGITALDNVVSGNAKTGELVNYMKTLGISMEEIRGMNGIDAVDFLIEKLGKLAPMGGDIKNSWEGVKNQFDNILNTIRGEGTTELFTGLKDGLRALTDNMKANQAEYTIMIADITQGVIDGFLWVKEVGSDTWNTIKEVAGVAKATLTTGWETLQELFPSLLGGTNSFKDAILSVNETIRENKEIISNLVIAWAAFKISGGIYGGVASIGVKMLELNTVATTGTGVMGLLKKSMRFLTVGGLLGTGLIWVAEKFLDINISMESVGLAAATLWDSMKVGFYGAMYFMGNTFNKWMNGVGSGWVWVKNKFNEMTDGIAGIWNGVLQWMGDKLNFFLNGTIDLFNKIPGVNIDKTDFGNIDDYKSKFVEAHYEAKKFFDTDWSKSKLESSVDEFKKSWGTLVTELKTKPKADVNIDPMIARIAEFKKQKEALAAASGDDTLVFGKPKKDTSKADAKAAKEAEKARKVAERASSRAAASAQRESEKLIANAKREAEQKAQYLAQFNDYHDRSVMSSTDYAKQQLEQRLADYAENGMSMLAIDEIRAKEMAKINARIAKDEKSTQEKAWKESVWGSGKAAEMTKIAGGYSGNGSMSKSEQVKSNVEAGKTFGDSFKKSLIKDTQTFEGIGSKMGTSMGNSLTSIIDKLADGGDPSEVFSSAVRSFADSSIDGMKNSGDPAMTAIGYAIDVSRIAFSMLGSNIIELETNMHEDNVSIANATDSINDTLMPHLKYTQKISTHIENMDRNFNTIAVALGRSTGVDYTGANFEESISGLGGSGDGFMAAVGNAIYSKQISLKKSGIQFAEQTVDAFMEGVDVQAYQLTNTKRSYLGGLFSSSKDSMNMSNVDSDIKQSFERIMTSGYGAIQESASALGVDASSVKDISIDLGALNFKDKTQQEIQDLLSGTFGAALDDMASAGMPALDQFMKVGESGFDTYIRAGAQYEQASFALDQMGIATVDYMQVANKATGQFGLETARTSIMMKESTDTISAIGTLYIGTNQKITHSMSGIGEIVENFTGSLSELTAQYKEMADAQLVMRMFAGNIVEINQSILNGAGGWESFNSGFSAYTAEFFTTQEQTEAKLAKLNEEFKILGIQMPKTREEFRKISTSLLQDPTKEAQEAYGKLIAMSGDFADAVESTEEAVKKLEEASQKAYEAIQLQLTVQTDLVNAQNRLNKIQIDSAKELESTMRNTAKDLRALARSSDSTVDSLMNVGLSDNQSIDYYLDKLNQKETQFATYFDDNGAVLADKYDDMNRTYGEINTIVGTLSGSLENYDPARKDYLKDNLLNVLGRNQQIVNSNAKIAEVFVKGGSLESIANDLNIHEFSTLLGLSTDQKASLVHVVAQTQGLSQEQTQSQLMKDNTFEKPYATVGVSNIAGAKISGYATQSTQSTLMKNTTYKDPLSSISIGNIAGAKTDVSNLALKSQQYQGTAINTHQTNFIAPEAGLLKDSFRTSTYKLPYATVGVSNIAGAKISGYATQSTQSTLMKNTTYKLPYATVGVSNIAGAKISGYATQSTQSTLMKNTTYKDPLSSISIGNIAGAKTDVSNLALKSQQYQGTAINVGNSYFAGMAKNTTLGGLYKGTSIAITNPAMQGTAINVGNSYFAGMAKNTTLGGLYKGTSIAITNPAMQGTSTLSTLLGSSTSGLQGILGLTSTQKDTIVSLEEKTKPKDEISRFYTNANNYYTEMLRLSNLSIEADKQGLNADSFKVGHTFGATEEVQFQQALTGVGLSLNAAQRSQLVTDVQAGSTPASLKTIFGFNAANNTYSHPEKISQFKALKGVLPTGTSSAYGDLKTKNSYLRNQYTKAHQAFNLMAHGYTGDEKRTGIPILNSLDRSVIPETAVIKNSGPWYHVVNPTIAPPAGLEDADSLQGLYLNKKRALPQFKSGGYTGDGNINHIAGITHKQEYVVPHKGALVLKENRSESKELKEIKEILKATQKELKNLIAINSKGNVIAKQTRKVEIVEEEMVS